LVYPDAGGVLNLRVRRKQSAKGNAVLPGNTRQRLSGFDAVLNVFCRGATHDLLPPILFALLQA
jgi:hypothetical protein